jgi:hypothetical protein
MQDDSPGGESWVSLSIWSPQVVQEPMANFLVEQTTRGVELKGNWIKAYCRQGGQLDQGVLPPGRRSPILPQTVAPLLQGPPATVPGTADAESTSGKPAK